MKVYKQLQNYAYIEKMKIIFLQLAKKSGKEEHT